MLPAAPWFVNASHGSWLCALWMCVASCSGQDSDANNPAFLRVEIVPTDMSGQAPQAVLADIIKAQSTVGRLCINASGKPGETAASFVLRREPDQDPSQRVQITVAAYTSLTGQYTVGPGKEFPCPNELPVPISLQTISAQFCPGESRAIGFIVGATCGCADGGTGSCECPAGQTCSAGLGGQGSRCGAGECCATELSDPCALEPAQ